MKLLAVRKFFAGIGGHATRLRTGIRERAQSFRMRFRSDRAYAIRVISLVIALDLLAFFSLASVNPLNLLNPLGFLFLPPEDKRPEISLYFPDGLTSPPAALPGVSYTESELDAYLVESRQKVARGEDVTDSARIILLELGLGPANLRARRFARDLTYLRQIKVTDTGLIVHLATELSEVEKLAIRKSLTVNLPGTRVTIVSPGAGG